MILISLIVFFIVGSTMQTQKKMDTALDCVGLAATMGLSAYVLAQLLAGGSANRQFYHGMTTAMAVGIATGVGSMVAKASHDYVLPHIPQAGKWKRIESALLNAGMAGASAWGYVALMDSDVAKANAVPIIGYAVGGEIVGQYIYDSFINPLWWGSSTKL